uniref:Reverse transcriptase domain-containing protein n=1 Tax=Oryza brachyantha TaxID=4533 RepID=J3MEN5_ORYBR
MKKDAAPGPDGFNVAFFRVGWNWLKNDLFRVIQNFYASATLPPGMNETNIVLIPKNKNPLHPPDFRPISLCNVSYKIIAKSLANQIKDKLPHLIRPNQQAFIKGRSPVTNIMIAQEVLHSFSLASFKTSAFLLKLDLSKAFDRLEWNFIAYAMKKKGFDHRFISLVSECISTTSFSVVVDGSGHPIMLAATTKSAAYSFLVDKFRAKFSFIRANKLSHAGRLTLIKSVFASIPIYYMSHILFTKKLVNKLIRKFRWKGSLHDNISTCICLRSWKDICRPIQEGGLGIRELMIFNKSLLTQTAWKILAKPEDLIAQVLKQKYHPNVSFWNCTSNGPKSAFWSSALNIRPFLHSSCTWQIAAGDTSIWNQPWCIYNYIRSDAMSLYLSSKISELWTEQKT